jgi:3-deoxy-D-manno-octulosonic acid (KDO) 8-phosphate synthase
MCAGSLFTVTLQHPPRIIGHTGAIKEKHIKEITQWIEFNMAVLMDVWEGRVNEKYAEFTTYEIVKVAAILLRQNDRLIAPSQLFTILM